jgi:hypothetical protein
MQCVCAILLSVACSALQYFSTLSHNRHDFRNEVTEHKIRFLILSTTFIWNNFYSKKNWARYNKKMYIDLYVTYLLFLSDSNKTWICLTDFRKSTRGEFEEIMKKTAIFVVRHCYFGIQLTVLKKDTKFLRQAVHYAVDILIVQTRHH